MIIRNVEDRDFDVVVKINNQAANWIGHKDRIFFEKHKNIALFYVIEEKNVVYGFIMVMDQSANYDSKNFLWFKEGFDQFYYIDRVVVDEKVKGKGLGSQLYKRIMSERGRTPLTCEICIKPENRESIRFHEKLGFKEVGIFSHDKKTYRMYILR